MESKNRLIQIAALLNMSNVIFLRSLKSPLLAIAHRLLYFFLFSLLHLSLAGAANPTVNAEKICSTFDFLVIEELLKNTIACVKTFKVTIVGGGEAGCHTAIALAKMKSSSGRPLYHITLIEKSKDLLCGTSRITPGRLGEGYHYNHKETALKYFQETMSFMKHYPNCVLGHHLSKKHPLRRGRYVVMKDSLPKPSEIFKIYKAIQQTYEEQVKENSANKIWGETKDFLKLIYVAEDQIEFKNDPMRPSHFKNNQATKKLEKVINLENVAFVVETAEELLDWSRYREETLKELAHYNNITVVKETEVQQLEHLGGQHFAIRCTNKEQKIISFETDFVVICAWERSDKLINTLNVTSKTTEATTNRLKSIVTIKLPQEMLNSHSYFFCMGPYAMFSNLGSCMGKITYAPVTNMQKEDASKAVPAEMEVFLSGRADEIVKEQIAGKILAGAKNFIPGLTSVTLNDIVEIGFGIVKTRGMAQEVDIYDPLGKIGERDYGWVRKHEVADGDGFVIQNDAMKIVYSLKNAEESKQLINKSVYLTSIEKRGWNDSFDTLNDSNLVSIEMH